MRPHRRRGRRDRTQELIQEIREAIGRESWGRNVLRLAWTAGPLTYLALQGGYLVGYGEAAPQSLIVYFVSYTIITGGAALLLRLIHALTTGREVERGTRALRACLVELPRLLLRARDLAVSAYDDADAPIVAANHLLSNPDATELAVAVAVRDLGGSRDLAYAMQRVEVFRRNGLSGRIEPERAAMERELERLLENLAPRSPATERLLRERSHWRPPDKRRGRPRHEGFLERGLAAEGDELLLSVADVEEILSLAVELIAGRSFPLLTFELAGDRDIAEMWLLLERARREFRSALRARNSRLRVVGELLGDRLERVYATVVRIADPPQLLRKLVEAADSWAKSMERPRLRRPGREERAELRAVAIAYRYLEQSGEAVSQAHARLIATAGRYRSLVERRAGSQATPTSFAVNGGEGVRITESRLSLDERGRLTLARKVKELLDEAVLQGRDEAGEETDGYLGLAVEVLAAMEDRLQLFRPEVQQAIELSRAPFFNSLEPGLSAEILSSWATALVQEVESNRADYARRRLEQLIRFHGIRLSSEDRERIAERFGFAADELPATIEIQADETTAWQRAPMEIPARSAYYRSVADGSVNQ